MALLSFCIALVLAPVSVYLIVVSAYLLLLSLGAWIYRAPQHVQDPTKRLKIACLIPAHNESGQIEAMLQSLSQLNYPKEEQAIFVLADNCEDNTAELARNAGAQVLERSDLENRGKGQALDWALQEHAEALAAYEAIALIDADMNVDPDFLEAAAASLENESVQVIQSLNTVSNPAQHWRAAIGFMSFTLINYIRPAGRAFLGGTAGLKGSGMIFRSPLLLQYGWPAHSPAEDAEFTYMLLRDGVRVHFNPNAKVTSDIPLQNSQARIQQERWDGGRLLLIKRFLPQLIRSLIKKPSLYALDALLDSVIPPLTMLVLLLFAALIASLSQPLAWTLVLLGCLAGIAFAILSGLILARAPLAVWLYLSAIPLFILWKIPALCKLFLSKAPLGWQRTPRDNELE